MCACTRITILIIYEVNSSLLFLCVTGIAFCLSVLSIVWSMIMVVPVSVTIMRNSCMLACADFAVLHVVYNVQCSTTTICHFPVYADVPM